MWISGAGMMMWISGGRIHDVLGLIDLGMTRAGNERGMDRLGKQCCFAA